MNRAVWMNRNNILLLTGQTVSSCGSNMQSFALALYVLDITGSATQFAAVNVVAMAARFLAPLAGVLADRVDRKKCLIFLDILSGLSTLIFGVMFALHHSLSLPVIYIFVFILNIIYSFFDPTLQAIIPDAVHRDHLAQVNSAVQFMLALVSIIAPLLAGVLYGSLGLLVILLVNGISFLVSAFSEFFLRVTHIPPDKYARNHVWADFVDGFRRLLRLPEILLLSTVALVANFALSPVVGVAVPFVLRHELGVSEYLYGLAQSLMLCGTLIGPLIAPHFIRKYHYTSISSTMVLTMGMVMAMMAVFSVNHLFHGGIWVNYGSLILGVNLVITSAILANISIQTARQKIVPREYMGRVCGSTATLSIAAAPSGQAVMGVMLDNVPVPLTMLFFALVVILSAVCAFAGFTYLRKRGKMVEMQETIS